MVNKGEFVEYNMYHDNYYGTSKQELIRIADEGHICILEIDINGAKIIYKEGIMANYIGVLPPSIDLLRARLEGR